MMNRRSFLTGVGSGLLGLGLGPSPLAAQAAAPATPRSGQPAPSDRAWLRGLLDQYRHDLFDDFLPFMDDHVIDHQHGGFMCHADRDGTQLNTDKYIWYEGRGIWVYAFLYNHFTKDAAHLAVARKSLDFVMRHRPDDDDLWPLRFTREGRVLQDADPPEDRFYGDLFVAEGMAAFAEASGEDRYFDLARDTLLKCVRFYDRPDYYPRAGQHYLDDQYPPTPGARILGHWMVLLRVATQMLRARPGDREIEAVASRSCDALLNHHLNPRFNLLNEILHHDLSRHEAYGQFVYAGHAIEALWMVMDEALRVRDGAMFDQAADLLQRHIEVAWDDVYGGAFSSLIHVDRNEWSLSKALWVQEEALIGTMMVIEERGAGWARDWFRRVDRYVRDNMVLRRHGFPLWDLFTDRQGTFERHSRRIGNYHHPRHLMLNILSLQRMAAADGDAAS